MSIIEERKFVLLDISGEKINTCYHEAGTENKESVIFAQTGGAGASAYNEGVKGSNLLVTNSSLQILDLPAEFTVHLTL